MDIWQILGIAPTQDLKTIKKAYSGLTVKYHPEDHPEEFRQINEAYKAAVKYAKSGSAAFTPVSSQPLTAKQPVRPFSERENTPSVLNPKPKTKTPDFERLIEQGQQKAKDASRHQIEAAFSSLQNLYLKTKKQRLKTLKAFLQSDVFAEFHVTPYFTRQLIHTLKKCPMDTATSRLIKDAYLSVPFAADETALTYQPLFDFLDRRLKRHNLLRSFITIGIVFAVLGVITVSHFAKTAAENEKYAASHVENYLENLYQIDLTVQEPKNINPEKDPTKRLYPEGRLYTVTTADQSLHDATGFEALWKKDNPEIELLSDTYARETSDYFARASGISPDGQWSALNNTFTNLCSLYYSPSEGKDAFVDKFGQFYDAVQSSHYLRQAGQMTVHIQASGNVSISPPLEIDIVKGTPFDKSAFQAAFSAYWDEDASKNLLNYQLLNP